MPRHPGATPEYDDDYTFETEEGVTLVPAAGKRVVDASEWLVRSELSYDNGTFFARLDANYTDERFYPSLNDADGAQYLQSTPMDGTTGSHELTSRS